MYLTGSIMYPVKYHNNWARYLFFKLKTKSTCLHITVFYNWCGELWMVYFTQACSDRSSMFTVIEPPPGSNVIHGNKYVMLTSKRGVNKSNKWIHSFLSSSVDFFVDAMMVIYMIIVLLISWSLYINKLMILLLCLFCEYHCWWYVCGLKKFYVYIVVLAIGMAHPEFRIFWGVGLYLCHI